MGRPINKRFLGTGVDAIKVSHYFREGDVETADQDTYIISQRSTKKFLISNISAGWVDILTLVDKDAGSLQEGEFRISALDPDTNPQNVVRLYNRTIRLGGAVSPQKAVWNGYTTANNE